jgi:hypothetical protein
MLVRDWEILPLGVTALLTACSFSARIDDVAVDAPPIDVPDAPGPTLHWMVLSHTQGPTSSALVLPVTDGDIETPCPSQALPGTLPFRDIFPHPTLPYVYGVEAGFHGTPVSCGALSWSGSSNVTTSRPIQRIGYDASKGVGFFTGDGPSAVGIYRFTTATDGTPTVLGTTDATAQSGALTLDASRGVLYVAGTNVVSSYTLLGGDLTLPTTRENATTCAGPVDVVVSGETVLAFCSDSPDIRRYVNSPFTFDATVGALGTVDRVLPLPSDRALAARATPDLAIVSLVGGAPTWQVGPTLGSRITGLAVSADGKLAVSARLRDGTTSEVATWRIEGTAITLRDTTVVPGVVSAVALTSRTP